MNIYSVVNSINQVYGQIGQANAQREVVNNIIVSLREQLRTFRGIRKNLKISFAINEQEFDSESLDAIEDNINESISSLSLVLSEISSNVNNYYNRLSDLRRIKSELEAADE